MKLVVKNEGVPDVPEVNPTNPWISLNKSMPNPGEMVLLSAGSEVHYGYLRDHALVRPGGTVVYQWTSAVSGEAIGGVTHYMPLPLPAEGPVK